MENLQSILASKTEIKRTTEIKNNINTVVSKYHKIDNLYSDCSDLTNPKFKLWYCKTFNKLGVSRVLELANLARKEGKNPRLYFSHLLRTNLLT